MHMCAHTHQLTCKQIPTIVLPPVRNLACVCFPAFFFRSVEIFSSDETCVYLLFSPPLSPTEPQPLKSHKWGSSILLFFHKAPSGGMTVIHIHSSFVPCSSHYQPYCSYYASTSSALIKMNVPRCHFMFLLFCIWVAQTRITGSGHRILCLPLLLTCSYFFLEICSELLSSLLSFSKRVLYPNPQTYGSGREQFRPFIQFLLSLFAPCSQTVAVLPRIAPWATPPQQYVWESLFVFFHR